MHVWKEPAAGRRRLTMAVLTLALLAAAAVLVSSSLGSTGKKHATSAKPVLVGKGGGFGEVYVANFIEACQDHRHLLRPLNDIHWPRHRHQQEGRNAHRPATRVQGEGGLSGKDKGVALLNRVGRPGLKDRIARIAYGKGRLPSRGAEFVVGNVRMGGVLPHGSGTARRRDELARIGEPPGTGIGSEIGS